MAQDGGRAVRALARFSRQAAEAKDPDAIWTLLADAAHAVHDGCASAVLRVVDGDRAMLAAARGVELDGIELDVDALLSNLSPRLVARAGMPFERALTMPLVADGDLLGALGVLLPKDVQLHPTDVDLAEGLADVAAVALARAYQLEDLRTSYADLRQSREFLVRTEKLRALGEMTAGISHDLKSILNGLSLPLQLLKRQVGGEPTVARTISTMEQTVARGVATVERLRDFSRQSPEEATEEADLDQLVEESLEICRSKIHAKGVVVERELGAPPPIKGRAAEIATTLVNLMINALDAMPKGGRLSLKTSVKDGAPVVEIADTGPGIPPEIAERVFEPFFTTKGAAGTGLGLSMAYACMRRHGGTIAFETAPSTGTRFILEFPRPEDRLR